VGSCSNVLSCWIMSDAVPRGLDAGRAYLVAGAPKWDDWTPGSLLGWGRRGDRRIGSKILPASI
jgi:hypothetical protein